MSIWKYSPFSRSLAGLLTVFLLSTLGWPSGPVPAAESPPEIRVAILALSAEAFRDRQAARRLAAILSTALAARPAVRPLELSPVDQAAEALHLGLSPEPGAVARVGEAVDADVVLAGEIVALDWPTESNRGRVQIALRWIDVPSGRVVSRSQQEALLAEDGDRRQQQEQSQAALEQAGRSALGELLANLDRPPALVLSAADDQHLTISQGARAGLRVGAEVALWRGKTLVAHGRVSEVSDTNAIVQVVDREPGQTAQRQDSVRVVYNPPPRQTSPRHRSKSKLRHNWVFMALAALGIYALVREARDQDGRAASSGSTTPAGAPATPQGFAVQAGDGEVRLYWQANTEQDLQGYFVYRSDLPDKGFSRIATLEAYITAYVDQEVTNGVTYYYRISAVDTDQKESAPTAASGAKPQSSEVPAGAPTAPPIVQLQAGDGEVRLYWQASTEADLQGYFVYRSDRENLGFSRIATLDANTTSYVDTTVTNGSTYYYQVSAVNKAQRESARTPTPPLQAKPVPAETVVGPDIPPTFPVGLEVRAQYDRLILTWQPNREPDLKEYRIYRAVNNPTVPTGAGVTPQATVPKQTTMYVDVDLGENPADSIFYYRITAVNEAGLESIPSIPAQGRLGQAPAFPVGLVVQAQYDRLILIWQPNSEPDLKEYRIYRAVRPVAEDNFEVPLEEPYRTVSPQTTMYVDEGLRADPVLGPIDDPAQFIYYYRITAVNLAGLESAPSIQAQGQPGQPRIQLLTPDHEQIFQSYVDDPSAEKPKLQAQVTFAWTPVANASRYIVEVAEIEGAVQDFHNIIRNSVVEASQTPSLQISFEESLAEMDRWDRYYWRVKAVNDQDVVIDRSQIRDVTIHWLWPKESPPVQPPGQPPAIPDGLEVRAEYDRLILIWKPNSETNLTGYRLYRKQGNLEDPGDFELLVDEAVLDAQTTTYIDAAVVKGDLYSYRLAAVNQEGLESALSIPAQGRPGQPRVQLLTPNDGQAFLGQVDNLVAPTKFQAEVNFAWTPVANASRYIVEIANTADFSEILSNPVVSAGGTPLLSFTFEAALGAAGLQETYYWRVQAVNDQNVVIDQSEERTVLIRWPASS